MLTPGNILYFNNYYFPNGNTSKPKYLIVLGQQEDSLLVYSLPTSQDKVPDFWSPTSGCNESISDGLSFYFFPANKVIASDTSFAFPLNTFLMGEGVDDKSVEFFTNIYDFSKDCAHVGTLDNNEFIDLLKCFSNSNAVKNKHKKVLRLQLPAHS